ncbi:MAG TPA: flavin reductase family protein [Anaerolineae bacterium]
MSVDQSAFKRVMRRWASGVTIVTTRAGREVYGLTVSGFGGISLDPALVMVSIGHDQRSHDKIREGGVYAVNILHADQVALSDRFASRDPEIADRFAGVACRTVVSGAPVLDDCLAWFDCRVVAEHVVGDHTLFIGDVLAGDVARQAQPLVYSNRGYYRLDGLALLETLAPRQISDVSPETR